MNCPPGHTATLLIGLIQWVVRKRSGRWLRNAGFFLMMRFPTRLEFLAPVRSGPGIHTENALSAFSVWRWADGRLSAGA